MPGFSLRNCSMSLYAESSASDSIDKISGFPGISDKLSKRTVQVDDRQVGARSNQTLAHDQTQTASTTRHDANLVLEGKLSQGALEMHPTAALDNGLGGILAVRRVLDLNAVIGTGKFSLMLAGGALLGAVGGGENGILVWVIFLGADGCEGERADRANCWGNESCAGAVERPDGGASDRAVEHGQWR